MKLPGLSWSAPAAVVERYEIARPLREGLAAAW